MAAFVQNLLTGQSKTAGTSLGITGSATITLGNTLIIAFTIDDVGSGFGATDNLGNTYTLQKTTTSVGNIKTLIFSAPVTVAGTLTTQTISWTTSATAKAGVSAEFSNVGTVRLTGGSDGTGTTANISINIAANDTSFFSGELWVGAHGTENTNTSSNTGEGITKGTPTQTIHDGLKNGTTGGSVSSNVNVRLAYILIDANSTANADLETTVSSSSKNAGAGIVFNAPVASSQWFLLF